MLEFLEQIEQVSMKKIPKLNEGESVDVYGGTATVMSVGSY